MNAGALHFAFHKIEPNGTIARAPRLHSWERREFLSKRSIQILRAFFVEAARLASFQQGTSCRYAIPIDRSRFEARE